MWSPVIIVTFISACGHLVLTQTAHTATVHLPDTVRNAAGRCILPQTLEATVSFGDTTINLTLKVNEDIPPDATIFTEDTARDKAVKTENVFDSQDVAYYQDVANKAAMTVTCDQNKLNTQLSMNGFITSNEKEYTLRKLEATRHKRETGSQYEMTEDVPPTTINDYRDPWPVDQPLSMRKESNIFSQLKDAQPVRHKRQTSEYYIDVLALIDYGVYKRWYDASTEATPTEKKQDALLNIRRYYAYVMNGVSLRYKTITGLSSLLNVRLVGYYVSETSSMAPWTETFRISGTVRSEVDADRVLVYLRDWVPTRSLPQHDHAMLFTGYDLYTMSDDGRRSTETSGLAYIRTLCRTDGRSISLVEDFGGFQCVDTAAHELGHSLGAKHDGDGNSCRPSDRFIMSGGTYPTTETNIQNPWFFSTCTVEYFSDYLATLSMSSVGIQCLTGPLSRSGVPDINDRYPGQLYVPDQQCKMIHGDDSRLCQGPEFGNSSQVCTNMFCLDPHSSGTCFQHEAARGTSCGDKRWCMDGICQYSEDAPRAVEGCVFGDQAGISFDDKTCEDFTSGENSAYCYQEVVRGRCCGSCQKYYTGAEECLYGDKVRGCDAQFCDYVYDSGNRYSDNCCQTCQTFTTRTTTPSIWTTTTVRKTTPLFTTTTLRPTTTSPSECTSNYGDAIGVTFNGLSCTEFVKSDPSGCYSSNIRTYCCASCRDKETGVRGCEYGNKFTTCDSDFCDYEFEDGTTYQSYCCDTCNKTRATTTTSTTSTTTTTPTTTTTTPSTTTTPTTTTTSPTTTTTTPTTTTTTPTTTTTTPTTTTTTPTTTTSTTTTSTTTTTTTTAPTTRITTTTCSDSIYGVTCRSYIRAYGRGRCYNSYVSSVCCDACKAVSDRTKPDCLYGDRLEVCNVNLCGVVLADDTQYTSLCCQTCALTSSTGQPTTTTPTTSSTTSSIPTSSTTKTTSPTTTSIPTSTLTTTSKTSTSTSISTSSTAITSTTTTTTSPCIDTRSNCSVIQQFNMVQCYDSDVERQCCETCSAYKDATNKGCEFGDQQPERCSQLSRPLADSCADEADTCCDTCSRFISAAGSFATSPFAVLLTTLTVLYSCSL